MGVGTRIEGEKPGLPGCSWWISLISNHWMVFFTIFYGVWVILPFLAPVLMVKGWSVAGKAIYAIYTLFCHQLPQRFFFVFGPQVTYSLAEIQASWQITADPTALRSFLGSPGMGWKVA